MRAWLRGIALVAALAAAAVMAQTNGHRAEIVAALGGGGGGGGAPTPAPTDPAPGYSAWFDAGAEVYTDAGGTTPAVADGDPINNWKSKGGSYGALACTVPGGYGAPKLKLAANGINGQPVVRSAAATFELLRDVTQSATIFEGGLINVGAGTVFSVVRVPTISGIARTSWGDNGGYISMHMIDSGGPKANAYLYDGAVKSAPMAASANTPTVQTWLHVGGLLYSGVNDTRTASMASVAAADLDATASSLVLLGAAGPGQYLDGDLAEVIFYPTALTQPDRKITERYLAAKYGITLPY